MLIQQIMRHEVEWGSVVNFIEEQYQTNDHDGLRLTYDTLLEERAGLDKLLDNFFEFTLATNENTTLQNVQVNKEQHCSNRKKF